MPLTDHAEILTGHIEILKYSNRQKVIIVSILQNQKQIAVFANDMIRANPAKSRLF